MEGRELKRPNCIRPEGCLCTDPDPTCRFWRPPGGQEAAQGQREFRRTLRVFTPCTSCPWPIDCATKGACEADA